MTSRAVIKTGYDFSWPYTLRLNGVVEDLSTATIKACLLSDDKATELITDTTQTNTNGASWSTGYVIIRFASVSTSLTAQNAWIEIQVTLAGEKIVYEDQPAVIEVGHL